MRCVIGILGKLHMKKCFQMYNKLIETYLYVNDL